jgi:hypothetical protein
VHLSLESETVQRLRQRLHRANAATGAAYPGDSLGRQPVHTLYGGAHLFKADTARKIGEVAERSMTADAPDAATLAQAMGIPRAIADTIYPRVAQKLRREPVEDFRIDFEDGYGNRPDREEDGHAEAAGKEVAAGMAKGTLPPFIGIRIKTFSDELFPRAARTMDIFLSALLAGSGGKLPSGFVVTLPKVTSVEQVKTLTELLQAFERGAGLADGTLRFEIMVETTQSLVGPGGECALPLLIHAGDGRCIGAHFGTYDYTASNEITAQYQAMSHPACDFARQMMKVALAGTGLMLSDGATNVMPVAPHREPNLTAAQREENRRVVHHAWRLSADHIRQSLRMGFYQGWDLHPAQLVVRYATVYAFFHEGLDAAVRRLRGFMDKTAQATLLGDIFDDAATGQGLLNFFLRGVSCGAISPEEAQGTGLTLEEISTRSFLKILQGRRKS